MIMRKLTRILVLPFAFSGLMLTTSMVQADVPDDPSELPDKTVDRVLPTLYERCGAGVLKLYIDLKDIGTDKSKRLKDQMLNAYPNLIGQCVRAEVALEAAKHGHFADLKSAAHGKDSNAVPKSKYQKENVYSWCEKMKGNDAKEIIGKSGDGSGDTVSVWHCYGVTKSNCALGGGGV
jgi:hypothetical protein